jgi:hypothetical protein
MKSKSRRGEWPFCAANGEKTLPAGTAETPLLALVGYRDAEGYPAIVIRLFGRSHVQIGQRNLFCTRDGIAPKRLSHDRVVADLFPMLVAKDQDRCRGWLLRLAGTVISGASIRGARSIGILIAVRLFLTHHPLLLQILPVPLVGDLVLAIVVLVEAAILVVPRTPQPRIVPAPTRCPRRTPSPIPAIAETESIEIVVMPVESMIVEGTVREAVIRGMTETARKPGAGPHAIRMHATEGASAADMPAASMAGKTTRMHSAAADMASTAMPAPTLRPDGYSQQKPERRNRDQATHTAFIIAPFRTPVRFSLVTPKGCPILVPRSLRDRVGTLTSRPLRGRQGQDPRPVVINATRTGHPPPPDSQYVVCS